jgi:acyl dehydratase
VSTRYFEELSQGDAFESEWATLEEDEIVSFAERYDPQPMHVDRDWARQGPHGCLIASGFQTVAETFRLFWDLGVFKESNIIGIGLDEIRWYKPVKAGQPFRARAEVLEKRESKSKPDRGVVRWRFSLLDEAGEELLSYEDLSLMRKKPQAESA